MNGTEAGAADFADKTADKITAMLSGLLEDLVQVGKHENARALGRNVIEALTTLLARIPEDEPIQNVGAVDFDIESLIS